MLLDSVPVVRYLTTPYYRGGHESHQFAYTDVLSGKCLSCDTLRRICCGGQIYPHLWDGEAAHQKAFTHNVAPQIIPSEWIYGWCMVVMDGASGSYETPYDAQIEYFTMRSRPPKESQGDAGTTELPNTSLPRLSFSFAVIRRAMISAQRTVVFQHLTSRDLSESINAP